MTRKDYLGISLILSVLICLMQALWYFYSKDEAMIIAMLLQFFPIAFLGMFVLMSEE